MGRPLSPKGNLQMDFKKLTVITGHYGSGKTNFAVNLALDTAAQGKKCVVVDLDIVNPYFRTADFEEMFAKRGIALKAPAYANSNLDIPALNISVKSLLDEYDSVIIDVGGDDEGAKALGRYAPAIRECESSQILYVINKYRYLTKEPEDALQLMREIEAASGLLCTGIVNNSCLGFETTTETVAASLEFAERVSDACKLPIMATAAVKEALPENAPAPYPVEIYVKTAWN